MPYPELAEAAAKVEPRSDPELKPRDAWRHLGSSLPRLDMAAKVDGTAEFGIDVRLDGMRYAAVRVEPRRSPGPAGCARALRCGRDTDTAERRMTMHRKLLHEHEGQRTFAIVLETGEEVMETLKRFTQDENVSAAQVTAIGAFSQATLAFFDWETEDYLRIDVDEQVEVASLIGDVALSPDGEPALHIHVVLGRRDCSALAGHLFAAEVRPTLEVILTESPAHLRKRADPASGLALISMA